MGDPRVTLGSRKGLPRVTQGLNQVSGFVSNMPEKRPGGRRIAGIAWSPTLPRSERLPLEPESRTPRGRQRHRVWRNAKDLSSGVLN